MAAQTQNHTQNQDRRKALIHPARVAELSTSDVSVEESELMTLNYVRHGDEIAETIEMLTMLETCIKNPGLSHCDRMPYIIRVSTSPHRNFITLRFGESDKRITYKRDGKIVIRTGNAVLLVDTRFVLFNYRSDGSLMPQVKSTKITWHGTEEAFDAYEFRRLIRDSITAVVEAARDVLQS